jgi:hypothetical protein
VGMTLDHYLLSPLGNSEYEFVSEGIKGQIVKIIRFSVVDATTNIVNLGFGDIDLETGLIND